MSANSPRRPSMAARKAMITPKTRLLIIRICVERQIEALFEELLRLHRLMRIAERRLERVPRETGAFHTDGEFPDAGKCRELPQSVLVDRTVEGARDHLVEPIEQRVRFGDAVPLDGVRHQRG